MKRLRRWIRRHWRSGFRGKATVILTAAAFSVTILPCSLLTFVYLIGSLLSDPTPTATPVPTRTSRALAMAETSMPPLFVPSATPTITLTPFPSATPTITPSPTISLTPAPTATPTNSPTASPVPTRTPTLAPSPSATDPNRVPARVTGITDGDTIQVEIDGLQYTVRYIGIDTPEVGQPYASECTAQNRALVLDKTVYLEKDVTDLDRYGRLLRYVWVGDLLVNAELVRLGYARSFTYPPDVAYQDLFVQLQQQAREASRGFWSIPLDAPAEANVVIKYVYADGQEGRNEPDEYCEIANTGGTAVNLAGWRLNAGNPGQDYVFPSYDLQPGATIRVYTNQVHPESGGFTFASSKPIWNNDGDHGYLFNASGAQVSDYRY